MEFGNTLFKLRKSKNMTLKEAAGSSVSVSHLSRVEKSENKISTTEFFEILENLNSTVEEFLYLKGDFKKDERNGLFSRIVQATNQKDFDELREIETQIKSQTFSPYSWEQFFLYLIENIRLGYDNKSFNPEPVLDYLMNVENWGEMECKLFMLFATTFNSDTIHALLKLAIKKSSIYKDVGMNKFLLHDLLRNMVSIFIFKKEINSAEKIVNLYYEKFAEENSNVNIHIDFLFNEGLIAFQKGQENLGKSKCLKAIELSEFFNQSDQKKSLEARYENWIQGSKNKEFNELSLRVDLFD